MKVSYREAPLELYHIAKKEEVRMEKEENTKFLSVLQLVGTGLCTERKNSLEASDPFFFLRGFKE